MLRILLYVIILFTKRTKPKHSAVRKYVSSGVSLHFYFLRLKGIYFLCRTVLVLIEIYPLPSGVLIVLVIDLTSKNKPKREERENDDLEPILRSNR